MSYLTLYRTKIIPSTTLLRKADHGGADCDRKGVDGMEIMEVLS